MRSNKEKIFYPDFFNDVFGPIMQPGSSGGFAGTDRIGRIARHALYSEPKRVQILFNPSEKRLVSLGTWMEDRAYLGGILDMETDDERLFDAHSFARAAAISYEFAERTSDNQYPHSTTFLIEGVAGDKAEVVASSIGGGMIRVHEINGFKLDYQGDTFGFFIWENNKKTDKIDELENIIEEILKDDYVATTQSIHEDGRKAYFIESSKDITQSQKEDLKKINQNIRFFPALLPVVTRTSRKPQLYTTVTDWRKYAQDKGISFVDAAILYEKDFSGWSKEEIWKYFEKIERILDGQVHGLERLNYDVADTPILPIYGKLWKKYEEERIHTSIAESFCCRAEINTAL